MAGLVHSIESFGTVDGPGVRLVVFLKGCPMRCLYCHNPDTWAVAGGTNMTVDEILKQYETSRHFYTRGGITVSGGEPLLQMEFVTELFEKAHDCDIHTCLDTSGTTFRPDDKASMEAMDRLIDATDLVMLDIKHIEPAAHEKLSGRPLQNILEFARYLDEKPVSLWIRHVVVPGYTDDKQSLYQLGQFIGSLKHIKVLDVLPYHDMGKSKYESLGIPYPLADTAPLDKEATLKAREIILEGIRNKRAAK